MADRSFLIGETVVLKMRITVPGTKSPGDPAAGVNLIGLSRSGVPVTLPTAVSFTKVSDGEYVLDVPSSGMAAGQWSWLAEARDDVSRVAYGEDSFVLRAPNTTLA